jgi:hypothetical protein
MLSKAGGKGISGGYVRSLPKKTLPPVRRTVALHRILGQLRILA